MKTEGLTSKGRSSDSGHTQKQRGRHVTDNLRLSPFCRSLWRVSPGGATSRPPSPKKFAHGIEETDDRNHPHQNMNFRSTLRFEMEFRHKVQSLTYYIKTSLLYPLRRRMNGELRTNRNPKNDVWSRIRNKRMNYKFVLGTRLIVIKVVFISLTWII